jgi:glycosyltransferase involved in cell wall biosynthesis
MYVGFLGWEANVVGAAVVYRERLAAAAAAAPGPRVRHRRQEPGSAPAERGGDLPRHPAAGFVDDLEEVYAEARVSVAPLLFGSGMKVKVLDAMARGMPTVTTAVGAEGIDYINGRDLAVASSADRHGPRIDPAIARRRSALDAACAGASRQLIGERYTWRRLFDGMHRHLDKVLSEHTPRGASILRYA